MAGTDVISSTDTGKDAFMYGLQQPHRRHAVIRTH